MDLGLNESQELLRRIAREFLEAEGHARPARLPERDERGGPPDLYRRMAARGWAGMVLPERYGGEGASFLDLCVLSEELGRAGVSVPLHDVWLSEYLLLELADATQQQQYLPALGRGESIATIALTEPSARYDASGIEASAVAVGNAYILNGVKLFVSNATIADLLLVVARTGSATSEDEGISVFAVPAGAPGVRTTPLASFARDRQCEVLLDGVRVPATALVGPLGGAWPAVQRVVDKGKVLLCAWSLGGAGLALERTADYAKARVPFGRPIGTAGAMSHKCADMAFDLDGMRFVVYHAAWRVSEGLRADQEIAIARSWTADAYRRMAALGHPINGGIGFLFDHGHPAHFLRGRIPEVVYGDAGRREPVAPAVAQ